MPTSKDKLMLNWELWLVELVLLRLSILCRLREVRGRRKIILGMGMCMRLCIVGRCIIGIVRAV